MSVFSLFVDLKANTADFVSGMSTASYAAKKAGRDIEDSFSRLGSVASAGARTFWRAGRGDRRVPRKDRRVCVRRFGWIRQARRRNVGDGCGRGRSRGRDGRGGRGYDRPWLLHAAETAAKLATCPSPPAFQSKRFRDFGFRREADRRRSRRSWTTGLERLSKIRICRCLGSCGRRERVLRGSGISVRDSAETSASVGEHLRGRRETDSPRMPDGVTKSALAMQIFGRSGDRAHPVARPRPRGNRKAISRRRRN